MVNLYTPNLFIMVTENVYLCKRDIKYCYCKAAIMDITKLNDQNCSLKLMRQDAASYRVVPGFEPSPRCL